MKRRKDSAGIALLMTLLVVSLLTIVVVEFTYSTDVEAHLTRHALSAMQARYLARAGLTLGELLLNIDFAAKGKAGSPNRSNVETLFDVWAQHYPPTALGDDGNVGLAGYAIADESGRFNVNSLAVRPGVSPSTIEARKTMFQAILSSLGLDTNLLFPVLDWLDPDDDVSGKAGAERDYYQALVPPYEPRNGRMLRLDELALVRGFADLTREQWAEFRALTTVLPNEELAINVNTAPEGLLTAILGAVDDAAGAKAIVAQRAQKPFLEMKDLNDIPGWSQLPPQVRGIFNLHSAYFTIHAVGVAGDMRRGIVALERRSSLRLDMLDWREETGPVALTSPGPSDGIDVFPSMPR